MKSMTRNPPNTFIEQKLEKLEELQRESLEIQKKNSEQITWLVGEYRKYDEEKTVGDYRQQENTDEIERLKMRTDRMEEKLQLPKMQFTF